jgi:hypothetical protein
MDRIRLSADLTLEMVGVLIFAVAFPLLVSNYQQTALTIFLIVVLELFPCTIFYYLLTMKVVEFDDEFLYLIGRGKEEEIQLERITTIKISMGGLNHRNFWKLTYVGVNGEEEYLTFVPKKSCKELVNLQNEVKKKSPKAIIENVASSLNPF